MTYTPADLGAPISSRFGLGLFDDVPVRSFEKRFFVCVSRILFRNFQRSSQVDFIYLIVLRGFIYFN